MHFKKLLFRAARGKAYTQFFELEISAEDKIKSNDDLQTKLVYIVIFEEGTHFKDRINKICASAADSV
jgi:hypothetical protein